MQREQIERLVQGQRAYFASGATLPVAHRLQALKKLEQALTQYEPALCAALQQDLGKSRFESYLCEVGLVKSELGYLLKHTRRFTKRRCVPTPMDQFAASSFVKPSPYGVALIMSPWNYPLLLTLDPLADALAAGNTAILKPSAASPATSAVMERLIRECFEESYVAVVTGGRQENEWLLKERFDTIFFTGSQAVGKEVLRSAAEHLTPVSLELGGKSPCIVSRTANIDLAARRIVFGKFLNCGQTCVAPDYVYCHSAVQPALMDALKREITRQFSSQPLQNPDYGQIINDRHFARLCNLLDGQRIAFGGQKDEALHKLAPTILADVTWEDAVMQEEIFGPILPVLTYDSLEQVVEDLRARPHPLALYLFTRDRREAKWVFDTLQFGGGCINDTVIHLATSQMGFGGVGASGMGAYHGKVGFDTFSHHKSIVDKKTWLDLPMRYQPYQKKYEKLLRWFLG